MRPASDRSERNTPERTEFSNRVRSSPPASSAQWRRRMGPLRSKRAESTPVITEAGSSRATIQARAAGESKGRVSGIVSLVNPGPAQPALQAFHFPLVGLVVVSLTVQDAMQKEDAELPGDRVAGRFRLPPRLGDGDQD